MRAHTDVDAVTIDALGTLVRLRDPVPALQEGLRRAGFERDAETVRAAFVAEVAHYKPRCSRGRDAASLQDLREECVGVFLAAASVDLPAAEFVDAFAAALVFEPEPGAAEALQQLAEAGLRLAVVSNWDSSLTETLAGLDLAAPLTAVVTSADAGAAKPDPAVFVEALARLGTAPGRTLHVGDEDADEIGATRAGLAFRPAPLAAVAEELLA
jgi:putative hydrolase of the HAD superfamily